MEFFKQKTHFDFMGSRKFWFGLSGTAVLLSAALTIIIGPKYGIEFAGGTEMHVSFAQSVSSGDVRTVLNDNKYKGAQVVTVGGKKADFLIRLQTISAVDETTAKQAEQSLKASLADSQLTKYELSPGGDKLSLKLAKEADIAAVEEAVKKAGITLASTTREEVQASSPMNEEVPVGDSSKRCQGVTCMWPQGGAFMYELSLRGVAEDVMAKLGEAPFGKDAKLMRAEWVGPKVGGQLRSAAISSVVFALLFIMLYIAVRFDLRFAPGAVIALIHDVVITLGIFTITRMEFTLATVAALLTIVGYSLNDTIVVFDRIRENMAKIKERSLVQVINSSVNDTLSRTILTSGTTQLTVIFMLVIGWQTSIRDFAFAMFIGIIVGTYSSIFIASPITVWFDQKFSKKTA
ncbi:MAG: protein translocase subunit SecF [Myxococcota bacterium]|jgi:preprotein translocase subunit SecF|nr:protein translocase subunit SecF [Myxococcota bacterium]